jgi:uncharacterized protein (TIGR01319 family)
MERIVITDIGSTTTKAILIEIENEKATLKCLYNSPTTVEKPVEDVKFGILDAIKGLESQCGQTLLKNPNEIIFKEGIKYLTTSSAGGGLQILVVGLTMVESASVAEKTALGAGGVILDTIAIDDKRSVLEQMEVIQAVHPDIILFSGGYDGGAITGIIRLSEILSLAHPKPKFGKEKIPLVYAGNMSIRNTIKGIFSEKFDLHIVDNIRPDLNTENVRPAQDKVHELFMENVMEQAPGYSEIKKIVDDNIIPTPRAVLHAMEILSGDRKLNLLTVDIGGATTDIFSHISEKSHRTVSANSGMSYSISNVLADAGVKKIKRWLHQDVTEQYICNYISNKMLYPQFVPKDELCVMIEQACAIEAVNIAFNQHMTMHFEEAQRFHFSNIKSVTRDPFYEHMYTEKTVDGMSFNLAKIDVVIGAGGVISHAPTKKQAMHTIIHGFKPIGITEIWRDVHFISPHLGKLSNIREEAADVLLYEACMERLGLYIRPKFKKKRKSYKLMTITLNGKNTDIYSENYYYFEPSTVSELFLDLEKGIFVKDDETKIRLSSDLPILINTYSDEFVPFSVYNEAMNLYSDKFDALPQSSFFIPRFPNVPQKQKVVIEKQLPYDGTIEVSVGEEVKPETLVGLNRQEPPKLMLAPVNKVMGAEFSPAKMQEGLLCKKGDEVSFNQRLFKHVEPSLMGISKSLYYYDSPTSGIIEEINCDTGIILIREKLVHAYKPIVLNVAAKLGLKPNQIRGYLTKREGDLVYGHEIIGKRVSKQLVNYVRTDATGFVTEIDTTKGTVTIHYDKKPFELFAHVNGKVTEIEDKRGVTITCEGVELDGMIGFGPECSGTIKVFKSVLELKAGAIEGKIIAVQEKVDKSVLEFCTQHKVAGLIAPSIDNRDWVDFYHYEIGVALTGAEKIGFGFIITEGFGDFKMKSGLADLLMNSTGKHGYLSPATQIRAGVKRPYLIIQ